MIDDYKKKKTKGEFRFYSKEKDSMFSAPPEGYLSYIFEYPEYKTSIYTRLGYKITEIVQEPVPEQTLWIKLMLYDNSYCVGNI